VTWIIALLREAAYALVSAPSQFEAVSGAASGPGSDDSVGDWMTTEIAFTTVPPQEASPLGTPGQRTALGHGVVVHGHPKLRARARLTTLPEASRDARNLTVPSVLRDRPEVPRATYLGA